jgi:SAM-dependent methyltransferase
VRVVGARALLAALIVAGAAHAQTPRPEQGQDGKDVMWVPTPAALTQKMLDLAGVTAKDTVLDLGSGDGRLVIAAAQRGARARGIEYTTSLVDYSREAAKKAGVADRAAFEKADLFDADLTWATVITLFLGPELNAKLLPKLVNLKPGTRIVSNTHPIGDWPHDAQVESTDDVKSVYYRTARLWVVPARVAGRWKGEGVELEFTQRYQTVSGVWRSGNLRTPLTDVSLRGAVLAFTAGGARYTARVSGATLQGQRGVSGQVVSWQATQQQR